MSTQAVKISNTEYVVCEEAKDSLTCERCGRPMFECGGRCTSAMLETRPMTAEEREILDWDIRPTPPVRDIHRVGIACLLMLMLTSCATPPPPADKVVRIDVYDHSVNLGSFINAVTSGIVKAFLPIIP
jgi:hypothetical protein